MIKLYLYSYCHHKDHSGYGLSQWEMTLHCNVVSHWRSPYPDWSLHHQSWLVPKQPQTQQYSVCKREWVSQVGYTDTRPCFCLSFAPINSSYDDSCISIRQCRCNLQVPGAYTMSMYKLKQPCKYAGDVTCVKDIEKHTSLPIPLFHYLRTMGLYSLSGKTSYRKMLWSLEAARFVFRLFQSLWNLTTISAAMLPRCLTNFRMIRSLYHPISRLRDFARFGGKTSYCLVNRGPGIIADKLLLLYFQFDEDNLMKCLYSPVDQCKNGLADNTQPYILHTR